MKHQVKIRVAPDREPDPVVRQEMLTLVALQERRDSMMKDIDDLCEEYYRITQRIMSSVAATHRVYLGLTDVFWEEVERTYPEIAEEPALAASLEEGELFIRNDEREARRQYDVNHPRAILTRAFERACSSS